MAGMGLSDEAVAALVVAEAERRYAGVVLERPRLQDVPYILEHSESAVVVTDADHAGDVESLVGTVASLQAAVVAPGERWDRLTASPPAPLVARQPEDPAWLFYTSGTTGRPKGATLTHRNLLEMSLRNYADIDAVGADDCILHVAPLSHATGLFSLFHIGKASNQVIPESRGFREDELVDLIGHYSKCLLFLAPTMLNRLVAHPASGKLRKENLKTLIYGGAPMYLEDLKRALERLGPCLWQGYGQGETPNTICFLSKEWHAKTDHPRYDQILSTV